MNILHPPDQNNYLHTNQQAEQCLFV